MSPKGLQAGAAGEALAGLAPGAQLHSVRQTVSPGFSSRQVWGLTRPCFRLLSHLCLCCGRWETGDSQV